MKGVKKKEAYKTMSSEIDEIVLQFNAVCFGYADMPVLDAVSFGIRRHEFIGMIGPNGGGKTTLLKLAMGFIKPQVGEITLFGKKPCESLLKIGYVPQVMQFDRQFPITVEDLVLAGRLSRLPWYGRFDKSDKAAARDAIDRLGLKNLYDTPFSALSGGQAQRALIARALATPQLQLLILDEPTANIDAQGEEEIFSLLKSLRDQMTIIMVTHDLQAALSCFDRVLCVHRHVSTLAPQQVCEHFALGLYHAPLVGRGSWKGGGV